MSDVINMCDYKTNTLKGVVKHIVDSVYANYLTTATDNGVYSYIEVDVLAKINALVDVTDITNELLNDTNNYFANANGIYAFLREENVLGTSGDIDSCEALIVTLVQDELNAKMIKDGYSVCFKLYTLSSIAIWDGITLIELSEDCVFDRILLSVVDKLPYEVSYIK